MSMRDYKVTYIWRGDLELEAESEADALKQVDEQILNCQGDPRGIFNLDEEEFEAEEA